MTPQDDIDEIVLKPAQWQYDDYIEAKSALLTLIHDRELRARLDERNSVALDNYRGHTFSDSTDWKGKYDKFIKNNERRLKALHADKEKS
jgi:hypothetical protein